MSTDQPTRITIKMVAEVVYALAAAFFKTFPSDESRKVLIAACNVSGHKAPMEKRCDNCQRWESPEVTKHKLDSGYGWCPMHGVQTQGDGACTVGFTAKE